MKSFKYIILGLFFVWMANAETKNRTSEPQTAEPKHNDRIVEYLADNILTIQGINNELVDCVNSVGGYRRLSNFEPTSNESTDRLVSVGEAVYRCTNKALYGIQDMFQEIVQQSQRDGEVSLDRFDRKLLWYALHADEDLIGLKEFSCGNAMKTATVWWPEDVAPPGNYYLKCNRALNTLREKGPDGKFTSIPGYPREVFPKTFRKW